LRKPAAVTVIHYVWADHLDTPRAITTSDTVSTLEWKWDSDPFGTTSAQQIALAYNLRFPGQYFDQETAKHYNYFRDYDPRTGRYLESDPVGMNAGINTYTYADPNPIGYIDRLGLQSAAAARLLCGIGGGMRGLPGGIVGVLGGITLGAILSCDTSPTPRDKCERQCDADNKRAAAFCHSMAIMKGAKGTKAYARAYQSCMAPFDEVYIECYQDCKRDYPD